MRMFSKLRRITARSSALVIGVAASAGGFTLPVAAKWNHRTLPAGGRLCLVYDESGYRVRSLKLRDTRKILYFDSRRPVLAPGEAPDRPGVLYVPLKTEEPGVLAIGPGRPIPNAHIEERPR